MTDRRSFLTALAGMPALLRAQQPTLTAQRVEAMTAGAKPAIALNHVGFQPDAEKTVLFRLTDGAAPKEFEIREIGSPVIPYRKTMPLRSVESDLEPCAVGDFSELKIDGMYQVRIGEERSVPFFINQEVWRRLIPRAFNYYPKQRCGVAVPNVHPVCHLEDATRTDNGEFVDATGGWHDAGDLRKWLGTTMLSATALLTLDRNLGDGWNLDGSGRRVLLDEVKWGNRYILKMQDTDGRIMHDVAGNPGNTMNHWTDNILGTKDDRNLDPSKHNAFQAQWVVVQAMVEQAFRDVDPAYGRNCLARAHRCWNASKPGKSYREVSWWTFAAMEMFRSVGGAKWRDEAAGLARRVLAMQDRKYAYNQKVVRGWWRPAEDEEGPLNHRTTQSAMAPLCLLKMAETFPSHPDAAKWKDAVRFHLDEYVMPLVERNAYRLMPQGVFVGSPTPERYRPLAGELTYRFFMPTRQQNWWLGTTSHIEGYAALMANAAQMFGERAYADVAVRQLEWVTGANPFGASLMTGIGLRQPYPHSRFVGLLDGAIMNGIAGNADDEPVLDTENGFDWRTTEYWQPHNAWFLWAVSEMER